MIQEWAPMPPLESLQLLLPTYVLLPHTHIIIILIIIIIIIIFKKIIIIRLNLRIFS